MAKRAPTTFRIWLRGLLHWLDISQRRVSDKKGRASGKVARQAQAILERWPAGAVPGPLDPSWGAFPDYSPTSMGWRMGSGEDYKYDFMDWYATLSDDERKAFQVDFPEPEGWEGYYSQTEQYIRDRARSTG